MNNSRHRQPPVRQGAQIKVYHGEHGAEYYNVNISLTGLKLHLHYLILQGENGLNRQ